MQPQFVFLPKYAPILYSDKRYFIISGGRGGGKSTQIAAYFIIMMMQPEYFRGVISRYTQRALGNSIYQDIIDLIDTWKLKPHLQFHGDRIFNPENGNSIITHAFRIGDASQVSKGKGLANCTHLLIDEATELPSDEEYIKTIDSFRMKGVRTQIFLLFNPGTKRHWIFRRWFLADGTPNPVWDADHEFIHTTYHDNIENIDPKKIEEWERMKEIDPEYYSIHVMGEWSEGVKGKIYKDWKVGVCDDPEVEALYGLDFGWHPDPSVCIQVKKKGSTIWLKEMVYGTELLAGDDMFDSMRLAGVELDAQIFGDTSNKGTIEDLRRKGYRAIRQCVKGNDSVRLGIQKVKGYTVYVDPDSTHIWDEYQLYCWHESTGKPYDRDNHCMDAIRYALSMDKTEKTTLTSNTSYHRWKAKKSFEDDFG